MDTEFHLKLYSTEYCELCESALELVLTVSVPREVSLEVVDIANDESLMTKYGQYIPVLSIEHSMDMECQELRWPFEVHDIERALTIW